MPALSEDEEAVKAWRLERLGGALTFEDVAPYEARPSPGYASTKSSTGRGYCSPSSS